MEGDEWNTHEEENMDCMSLSFKRNDDLNQKMGLPALKPHRLLGPAALDPFSLSLTPSSGRKPLLQPRNFGLTYLDSVQALSEHLSSLEKQWMMFQTEPAQG